MSPMAAEEFATEGEPEQLEAMPEGTLVPVPVLTSKAKGRALSPPPKARPQMPEPMSPQSVMTSREFATKGEPEQLEAMPEGTLVPVPVLTGKARGRALRPQAPPEARPQAPPKAMPQKPPKAMPQMPSSPKPQQPPRRPAKATTERPSSSTATTAEYALQQPLLTVESELEPECEHPDPEQLSGSECKHPDPESRAAAAEEKMVAVMEQHALSVLDFVALNNGEEPLQYVGHLYAAHRNMRLLQKEVNIFERGAVELTLKLKLPRDGPCMGGPGPRPEAAVAPGPAAAAAAAAPPPAAAPPAAATGLVQCLHPRCARIAHEAPRQHWRGYCCGKCRMWSRDFPANKPSHGVACTRLGMDGTRFKK